MPLPIWFCRCSVCQAARADAALRRTRSSLAIIDRQVTLVDAGPDLEAQLEREQIDWPDDILITHWHYGHIAGRAALPDMPLRLGFKPIELWLPAEEAPRFERELAYAASAFRLHPLTAGDRFTLPDAAVQVVKTDHTAASIGYVFSASRRWAYLGDGCAALDELRELDLLYLEASLDDADHPALAARTLEAVAALAGRIGARRTVLTHLFGHRLVGGQLTTGLSAAERRTWELAHPGIICAHDGLRITL